MNDQSISQSTIKSYVYYQNKCFYVSTIERNCSAMEHGDYRYNETIVFDYNRETREVGKIIHMDQDTTKSIKKHLAICQDFYLNGCAAKESD